MTIHDDMQTMAGGFRQLAREPITGGAVKKDSALALRLLLAGVMACLSGPLVAATFEVNHSGDAVDANPGDGLCATASAVCTLRAAIEEANASANGDHIDFNIGGGGPVTIAVTSDLPAIERFTAIHGYTQPGSSPNTLAVGSDAVINVRLDGGNTASRALFFQGSASSGSSVRGVAVTRFTGTGIAVNGAEGVTIAGNFVGTDGGAANLGNGAYGILVYSDADNAVVGGPNPADRNVVAFNQLDGIGVAWSNVTNALVRNNYIGTAPDGVTPQVNGQSGIRISEASGTTVRDNVIASSLSGIRVVEGGASGTVIHGNSIGVGADGSTPIVAGEGVAVLDGVSGSPNNVLVGGIDPGQGNVIANTQGAGVRLDRAVAANPNAPGAVAIRGNAIYNNAGMGIDLGDSATGTGVGVPNPNDLGDGDAGANGFQNFPVVTSATTDGMVTTVSFTYDSSANGEFWVDAYVSPSCDAVGYGEGRFFLASATLPADISGHLSATLDALPATAVGHYITLTATDTLNWTTSEFSACVQVTAEGGATPPVMGDVPNQTATVGVPFSLDISAYVTLTEGDPVGLYSHVGTLPPGLNLDPMTGVVSGTPTAAGTWTVSVAALDDDGGSNFDSVRFDVAEAPLPPGGTLQFALASQTVSEGVGSVVIAVTRTGGSSGPVSVAYATESGSAISPADFAAASGTLNWADGDTASKTFAVSIVDDAAVESTEQFTLHLTDNAPTDTATLGSPSVQTVSITDNDQVERIQLPVLGPFGLVLLSVSTVLLGTLARRCKD